MSAPARGNGGVRVRLVLKGDLLVLTKDLDLRGGETELGVGDGGRKDGGHLAMDVYHIFDWVCVKGGHGGAL